MTDFYIRKPNDLSDYVCDQTVVINKKYLENISGINYKEPNLPNVTEVVDWYPFPNSCYPYTEDVDTLSRVNHLLDAKTSFKSFTSVKNCECECMIEENIYSEKAAQLQYLYSNPVSFVILGKPGIGEQELGKLLADYWHCVYIEPENLILEEIQSGTVAGQCIEFNLRCGRAIGIDIILRLLEKRVKSKTAQHRGVVLCGFPMILNDLYKEDPVTSESVVFNVKDIFEEIFNQTIEIGVPYEPIKKTRFKDESLGEYEEEIRTTEEVEGEEKEGLDVITEQSKQKSIPFDIGSATSSDICIGANLETNFEEQINLIFSMLKKPFIIVYIVCSNSDVISKHDDYRFDFYSRTIIDLQREHADKMVYTYFSRAPSNANDEIPDDFIDIVKNYPTVFSDTRQKLLVKLPKDFPANVATMLDHYRYRALPVIEKYILTHDVQYFIKLDGRISPIRMFNALKTRLRVLPLQKVVIPQNLVISQMQEGESSPTEDINTEQLSHEECFEIFCKRQIASSMFKWGWSDWGIKCPVSMYEGNYRDGDSKFALRFMNKIFFLSDETAHLKFYRNPRPYLLPPYPKSSRKMFVMGPSYSGKSALSKGLGYLLQSQVLDYNQLYAELTHSLYAQHRDDLRAAATEEAIKLFEKMNREREDKRKIEVANWSDKQIDMINYCLEPRKVGYVKDAEGAGFLTMSSFPLQLKFSRKSEPFSDSDLQKTLVVDIDDVTEYLLDLMQLETLPPNINAIETCREFLEKPTMLLDYLPHELQPEVYNHILASSYDDFIKNYVEENITLISYSHINLTNEEMSEVLIQKVKEIEESNEEKRGGWLIDGIPPNIELFNILLPHCCPQEIFLLKGEGYDTFLLERILKRGDNELRDYKNFFTKIGKPEVAERSPSLLSTSSHKTRITKNILSDIVCTVISQVDESTEDPRKDDIEAYTQHLATFDHDWTNLINIISEYNIVIREIDIANKTPEELLKGVVKYIDNQYGLLASDFTDQDRIQELEDFGEHEIQDEDLGEAEEKEEGEDLFFQNRRFGDTFNYCPVTFHDYFVLWKGKEEHIAKFNNKVYLMCNENAKNMFIENPRNYLLIDRPPDVFPPPRICIVGPRGCGKTTVIKQLFTNLGLYRADYGEIIKKHVAPMSKLSLLDIIKLKLADSYNISLQDYLQSDKPLEEELLDKVLSPLWFEDPKKTFGFILEGFPRRPSDVDYMIGHATIPDIIIEMTINQIEIHNRLVQLFSDEWITGNLRNLKQQELLTAWKIKRNTRFEELMQIKISEKEAVRTLQSTDPNSKRQSKVSYDLAIENADIEEINNILNKEFPKPSFPVVETMEEAVTKFAAELEDSFISELDFIGSIREKCEAELIPWVTVDAGVTEEGVYAQIIKIILKYKYRNRSLFERVYDISVDLSEKLLSSGYYFLSKFGKTCPVQISENVNPIQMYLPLEATFQIYPVIHRQFIYFLAGSQNLAKFKENPLKYTMKSNVNFPLIPLKLSIIGPPKCGKTTLVKRFKRDLGLQSVTPGKAGRYVLQYMEFSELAKNMNRVLYRGWELTSEMIAKSIQAVTYDGKSITQGFVLDGFPNTIEEVRHLAQLGLIPNLVLDLKAIPPIIHEFMSSDTDKRNLPKFSQKFIDHRYEEWNRTSSKFRIWFDKEYQILGNVIVTPCKWGAWNECYEFATAVFSEVKHYYRFAFNDVALRLANMQITPLEFIERQGAYKNYCPVCLYYHNILNDGGDPPDRTGVVQYRRFYYYVCPEHIEQFLANPQRYLLPYNPRQLPIELPVRIFPTKLPENCHENGICIVCFWLNQPRCVSNNGILHYAVLYREKVYLFERFECMEMFMREPHKFFSKLLNFKGIDYPALNYKDLPILGLLEQYDVKQIIKAINNVSILRPVIPGLSVSVSAALTLGMFLKVNNPRTPQKFVSLYIDAQKKLHSKRLNLISYLAQMKKVLNPYLYYDEPLPTFIDPLFPPSVKEKSGSSSPRSTEIL